MLRLFGTVVMRRRVVHRPSEERATADDSDVPAPEDLDPDMQYVWGLRYIDDLILRDRDTSNPKNGTLNERLYAMQDANWNVVALADSNGDVVERYLYSAYGDPLVLNADFSEDSDGADYAWEFRFTGRRTDLETDLMYYRNRMYHPGLGRFVSRDPVGYASNKQNGSLPVRNTPLRSTCAATGTLQGCGMLNVAWEGVGTNLYRYVDSRPVSFVDPSGLRACLYHGVYVRYERVPGSKWWSPWWLKWRCVYKLKLVWHNCVRGCEWCPREGETLYGPPVPTPVPGLFVCNVLGVPRAGACKKF